jgi:hypothetical protein
MKFLKTLILILWAFNLEAQVEAILKDPNIVWAAEFEIDFIVDNKDSADLLETNSLKTLKLLDVDSGANWDEPNFLSAKILNSAFQDKIEMFGESTFRQIVNSSILSRRDSVDLCISAMYNERRVLVFKVGPEEIFRYRAKQIIFYNSNKNTFEIQSVAVALTKNSYDDAGNYMGITPLFWMKATNKKVVDIKSQGIVWGKRLTTSKNSIIFDSLKVIKNNLLVNIIPYFLKTMQDKEIRLYSKEGASYKRLTPLERQLIYSRKDTIYNVEDYSEPPFRAINSGAPKDTIVKEDDFSEQKIQSKIVDYHLNYDEVKKLKLVQEWFWDDKKKQLIINLVSTAPLIPVKDDAGNFLYDRPLFYRKTKDD